MLIFTRNETNLSNNGENTIRVHSLVWPIETGISHTIRVEVAAIGIACPSISIARVCTATCISVAAIGKPKISPFRIRAEARPTLLTLSTSPCHTNVEYMQSKSSWPPRCPSQSSKRHDCQHQCWHCLWKVPSPQHSPVTDRQKNFRLRMLYGLPGPR